MSDFDRSSMLEMFTYEMGTLLEQLEQNIIQSESGYSMDEINEIFRIMHTIKGSAAMMLFDSISSAAHAVEDLFYFLRENSPAVVDYSTLTDLVLEGMDFCKNELTKIENGSEADGDGSDIISRIKTFLQTLKDVNANGGAVPIQAEQAPEPTNNKQVFSDSGYRYCAKIKFAEGCEMENIRAYTLVHNLGDKIFNVSHDPDDIINEDSISYIRNNGFTLNFSTEMDYGPLNNLLMQTVYLESLDLEQLAVAKSEASTTSVSSDGLKKFAATVNFQDDAEMENVRAYTLIHNLEGVVSDIEYEIKDLIDESSIDIIKRDGFKLTFKTNKSFDDVNTILSDTIYLKDLDLEEVIEKVVEKAPEPVSAPVVAEPISAKVVDEIKSEVIATVAPKAAEKPKAAAPAKKSQVQHVISVNVSKLDQLLNLMGELVIAEAMVTQNPELEDLELESFRKETRQLRKIINDVQNTVMSMRMVSLSTTFFKMNRIVRDMCKQLNKDVNLIIIGEDTEVDKNIIEHIADPLMHVIRNSVDHGIEMPSDRIAKGKKPQGTVFLEAKNSGGDVLIIIRDDGAGINRDKVMAKAIKNGLLKKEEREYTEKEIHQFIFLPGFSTNEAVTNYSGRGVGMDVVSTNLEIVGGSVTVDSVLGEGSTFVMKIPLTLAIIEGMTIRMGSSKYTIPIISIKQSIKVKQKDVFMDPDGNEMITVRGEVYNIIRLNEFFNVEGEYTNIEDGIMIMLENGEQTVCLFADELIGEQQVVVKTMPKYIKKIPGISGCTLLGNGDISLIIDVIGFFDK